MEAENNTMYNLAGSNLPARGLARSFSDPSVAEFAFSEMHAVAISNKLRDAYKKTHNVPRWEINQRQQKTSSAAAESFGHGDKL